MRITLSLLECEEGTRVNMHLAIDKHNKKSLVALTEPEFRRLALELLSQLILQDKEIPIQLQ